MMAEASDSDFFGGQGHIVTVKAPMAQVVRWCASQWGTNSYTWHVYAGYHNACDVWLATENHLNEIILAWG